MMRRLPALIVLILFLAGFALAEDDFVAEQREKAKSKRIQVNIVVKNAAGRPLPGIMVKAQKVGEFRDSLTDREGKCGLQLTSGRWVIKAIRLQEGELLRREIVLGEEENFDLSLVIGAPPEQLRTGLPDSTAGESGTLESPGTTGETSAPEEISAQNLDDTGKTAAAELSKFTDSVLQQAWMKIIDQYAAQNYKMSIWLPNQQGSSATNPSDDERNAYRLDLDWQGNLTGSGNRSRQGLFSNLLANRSALSDVPVSVDFSMNVGRATDYAKEFSIDPSGNGSNLTLGNPRSSLPKIDIPGSIGNFLTGGEEAPENVMGYDLSTNTSLRALGNSNFRAFYNEVSNNIVNLYRPLREHAVNQAVSPSDSLRAVEFAVSKSFLGGIRAVVHYSYSEAGGLDIRTVNLQFEEWQDFENFLEVGLRHDLATTLEASFSPTGTRFQAVYRMYLSDVEDVNFSDKVSTLMSDHSRVDLSLQQRINIGILPSARISFSFAVNNLLNSSRNSSLTLDELEDEFSSRKLLGGIRIEF